MIRKTGYLELTFLLEHLPPYDPPFGRDQRDSLVRGVFPSMSGAGKMTFLPDSDGPLGEYRRQLVLALAGDRAPFASSGKKLRGPVGYKVVRLDVERDAPPRDFIRNTAGVPRSMVPGHSSDLLERPIDVKVGPDGYLYVLDMGQMVMKGGKEHIVGNTGQVFRLRPPGEPATAPSGDTNQ
jgi:glucose/arabinose dehydrogenase